MRKRLAILGLGLASVAGGALGYKVHSKLSDVPPPPSSLNWAAPEEPAWQHPPILSKEERQHLLEGQFSIITSTETMPGDLKRAFAIVTSDGKFSLANPGEKYQSGLAFPTFVVCRYQREQVVCSI